jgi:hypothetical protein
MSTTELQDMMKQVSDARRYLANTVEINPDFKYKSFEEYVLEHGRSFSSGRLTPDQRETYEWALTHSNCSCEVKQCFANACELVLLGSDALQFVEGFAIHPPVPLPVHHAWVCLDDRVIDVTWRKRRPKGKWVVGTYPSDWQYFGVCFDTEYVRHVVVQSDHYCSMLDNPWLGWPLLRGEDARLEASRKT